MNYRVKYFTGPTRGEVMSDIKAFLSDRDIKVRKAMIVENREANHGLDMSFVGSVFFFVKSAKSHA